jgi:hypothetical protein
MGHRLDMVRALSAEGMSTRAIAPIIGATEGTVRNDLKAGAKNYAPAPPTEYLDTETGELTDTPAPITGMDGKQYTRPEPAEPSTKVSMRLWCSWNVSRSRGWGIRLLRYS